MAKPLKCWRRN